MGALRSTPGTDPYPLKGQSDLSWIPSASRWRNENKCGSQVKTGDTVPWVVRKCLGWAFSSWPSWEAEFLGNWYRPLRATTLLPLAFGCCDRTVTRSSLWVEGFVWLTPPAPNPSCEVRAGALVGREAGSPDRCCPLACFHTGFLHNPGPPA